MSRLSDTRIYVIEDSGGGRERLVRAPNKSRAVKQSVEARIASQADLERLLAAGVVVEGEKAAGQQQQQRRRTR